MAAAAGRGDAGRIGRTSGPHLATRLPSKRVTTVIGTLHGDMAAAVEEDLITTDAAARVAVPPTRPAASGMHTWLSRCTSIPMYSLAGLPWW
jgi:hypothetical protein